MNEHHRFGGRRIQRVNITTGAAEVAGACSETGARGNFGYFCNGNKWYTKIVTFILHCARRVRIWRQTYCVTTSGQNSCVTGRLSTFLPRVIREPHNAAADPSAENDPADCAKDSLGKQYGSFGSLRKGDAASRS